MPSVTLSLPAAIGLLALFLTIGAVLVYFALKQTPEVIVPATATPTATMTTTPTLTTTPVPPTTTYTPEPSATPQTYLVQENDTCLGIAAFFGVSVQSIVTLNGLPAACDTLYINQPLLIPQPTPTVTPTGTPSRTPTPRYTATITPYITLTRAPTYTFTPPIPTYTRMPTKSPTAPLPTYTHMPTNTSQP